MESRTYADQAMTSGMNCAQAVLTFFAEDYGLSKADALRVSAGFGSGMRMALVCGAVTGAIMVLGLHHGMTEPSNAEAKRATNAATAKFNERFREIHPSVMCEGLLGIDVTTPDGLAQAKAEGLFVSQCRGYVADAIEILKVMLRQ